MQPRILDEPQDQDHVLADEITDVQVKMKGRVIKNSSCSKSHRYSWCFLKSSTTATVLKHIFPL